MAGYETVTMKAALRMIYAGEVPAALPGGPRNRKPGEADSPIEMYGGTLNHWKIGLFIRILWLCATNRDPEQLRLHVEAAIAAYEYELAEGWECKGGQCEQGSPSHGQQNESPAWGLLYVALRFGLPDLAAVVFAWLRASLDASDVTAPPVPWEKPDGSPSPVGGLLTVGPRAFTDDATGTLTGGRCIVRDKLYSWFRLGHRPELGNPLEEVDEASLHLAALIESEYLPNLQELLNASPRQVPPLRYPVETWISPQGRAYRLQAPGLEGAQHLASVVGGQVSFAFTPGAPLPAGQAWVLRGVERGSPIREYPAIAIAGGPKPATVPAPAQPQPASSLRSPAELAGKLRGIADPFRSKRPALVADLEGVAAEVERLRPALQGEGQA